MIRRYRRNPQSLYEDAKYFQYLIMNMLAGYPGGFGSQDYQRLLSFLEKIITTSSKPQTTSPFKTYSQTGEDPFTLPSAPAPTTPPQNITSYVKSEKRLNELERRARLGNQQAILDYLQSLDYQGHLDLDHLWVVPYTYSPYDIDTKNLERWMFTTPFPYILGLDLAEIKDFYKQYSRYYDPRLQISGAFVVDISTLELSDMLNHKLVNYFYDYSLEGGGGQEKDIDNIGLAAKFFLLNSETILIIDKDGWHLPEPHEISLLPKRERESYSYWSLLHRMKHPGKAIRGSGPVQTRWPERQVRQLPLAHFPERAHNLPYVIIVHTPTYRAFALSGGYSLLDEDVEDETVLHAMRYNRQTDHGWLPTSKQQRPDWVNDLLKAGESARNFIAYWVAE